MDSTPNHNFLLKINLSISETGSPYSPRWSGSLREPPAFVSEVLGLKVDVIIPDLFLFSMCMSILPHVNAPVCAMYTEARRGHQTPGTEVIDYHVRAGN